MEQIVYHVARDIIVTVPQEPLVVPVNIAPEDALHNVQLVQITPYVLVTPAQAALLALRDILVPHLLKPHADKENIAQQDL